jgi:peptide/nickel transport system permease protein
VIPATIELGVLGAILGAIIGTAAGVSAGARHGSWFDSVVRVGSLVLYSTPIFWLALMSLVILYSGLGIVPGPGRLDLDYLDAVPTRSGSVLVDTLLAGRPDAFLNALAHLALPLAVLTAAEAAWFARMTRAFTLEQVNQEYVLVARAKGLSERAVVWRHIFPNIRIQLITITAVALAGSLEGAVLIEAIFAWPGFGAYFVNALVKGDMNAVLGCTLVVGLLFTVSSAVAEVLYRRADPRVRT